MARVTVEDCLARIPNRFALTILGSRRARALSEGRGRAMIDCDNKEGVTALREISAARVRFKEDVGSTMLDFIEEQRRQLRVTTTEHTFIEAASLRMFEDEEEAIEEETSDVEELQPDPEALHRQASKGGEAEEEETTEVEGEEDEVAEPVADEEFPADEEEPGFTPDDEDGDDGDAEDADAGGEVEDSE